MRFDYDPFAPRDPDVIVSSTDTASGQPEPAGVPKGTSPEVLAWVNGDKDRAQLALDAENETHKPRKGLVEELEELLGE